MRVVVTRPESDGKRTAAALRARGHEVLVAPLMKVQAVDTDLSGQWGGVIITSANAPGAIAGNPEADVLMTLPLIAVGQRSANAAQQAGFTNVASAGGSVRDLVRTLSARDADKRAPLLYLAGEDRAADLVGELTAHGIAAEMRVVYRAVTTPFPAALTEALKAGAVDAVLHFSRRSAENFVAGAKQARAAEQALAVRHFCLSAQIAEVLAGAGKVTIARHPDESALIELLQAPAA
jgi:uroporphyrinogen-III synthase